MEDVEKRVIGKVMRRLIPFLILCYFVAYLDRVNVGFAKLHMNQALSDRTMERKGHVAVALLMATIGVGLSGIVSNPVLIMALLCFAQIGISAVPPMFWPLPASFLTGASAAAGIAAINSLGNLSGFAGPYAMGYLKDLTGNFTAGLLLLGSCALVGAIVVMLVRIDARRERLSSELAVAH